MSELRNLLQMLLILKRGGKVKAKVIAEKLEVNERQIRRYKETLDEFFDIESTAGPDGGYRLNQGYFPFKEILTEEEIMNIKFAISALDTFNFKNNEKLSKAIDKINFSILNNERNMNISEHIIPYSVPNKLTEEIVKLKDELYGAILGRNVVHMEYRDNSGKVTARKVEPLKYLIYKGEFYLAANCLLRNELRYFKLARIINCEVSNRKFQFHGDIDEILKDEEKNSLGIFGGDEYSLVLEIKPPLANTIKERLWVENQTIDELTDGTIIFKAKMKGGPELISWILSMGDSIKVLEPEKLKNKVKEKLEKMINNI
ncbi:MAG: WYL domain-containing protein [Clostridiaceae bacterium]